MGSAPGLSAQQHHHPCPPLFPFLFWSAAFTAASDHLCNPYLEGVKTGFAHGIFETKWGRKLELSQMHPLLCV